MDNNTIGEQIMLRRRKLGVTQTKLAKVAHISRNTLNAIENNRNDSRILTLGHIAKALKCKLSMSLEVIE